jgi:hypothetical protein
MVVARERGSGPPEGVALRHDHSQSGLVGLAHRVRPELMSCSKPSRDASFREAQKGFEKELSSEQRKTAINNSRTKRQANRSRLWPAPKGREFEFY